MASIETEISLLNGLIETTIDSADGYEQAAATDGADDLAGVFRSFASERHQIVSNLRARVVALGGTPEDDGTLLGSAHRGFLRIKAAFGSSRKAVINEVEAGEDHIKAKYEKALAETLTPETRQVVETAHASVRAGHDKFSAMKHSQEA